MNSVSHDSPWRMAIFAVGIVAMPFAVLPVSPLLSAAIGIASAHLWLFNMPARSEGAVPPYSIGGWIVAISGISWLMTGMMLLARFR